MAENLRERTLGTHDGSFHADEVTASALLALFDKIDSDKIVRTRDPEILKRCEYVCDVGGVYDSKKKRFDHHQIEYTGELSSAGMVWLFLKEEGAVDVATYAFLNQALIWGVDAHDNGKSHAEVGVTTFSQVISNFMPIAHEASSEELDRAFLQAHAFALGHLKRLLERYHYTQRCRGLVQEAMGRGEKFLEFGASIPWMDVFFDEGGESHPALFVVMPSGAHWKVRGIPPTSSDRMRVRLSHPEAWAGLMGEDLRQASGVEGAIFCHKGRFISVWETRQAAMSALRKVLEGL